jgi:UDP-N-acetylmuramyl pentapeptide phosphotransferase/UDP-N-acetylglucosamine-1-phosphate transferase
VGKDGAIDAGSLFLGFVLAVLLLKLRANAPTRVQG